MKRAQAKNKVELLAAMNGVRTVITAEDCNNYVARVNTKCNNRAHHNVDYFDKKLPHIFNHSIKVRQYTIYIIICTIYIDLKYDDYSVDPSLSYSSSRFSSSKK